MGEYIPIMSSDSPPEPVEILILGAGWTSKFLIPILSSQSITYAATTTTGHDSTIPFKYDPTSHDLSPYKFLPPASTILITFPLKGPNQSAHLVTQYTRTHPSTKPHWIQLGSTGIFTSPHWNTYTSPYDTTNARAIAEDELLALGSSTVLNLAGLYDDTIRRPRNWVNRVAKTKGDVKAKLALHLIHGADVAAAIVAAHENFAKVQGKRWIVTDLWSYDWWALFMGWGGVLEDGREVREVVFECMEESKVRALPRGHGELGRVVDSRDFWKAVGIVPGQGRVD